MTNDNNQYNDLEEDSIADEVSTLAERIYRANLPAYLQESWSSGRGKGYEDWLREQLDILVISEIYNDPARLEELQALEDWAALVFGIFGATFRILDHVGMHLRGQTFGQYELLPEDYALLRNLCERFSERELLELNSFSWIFKDTDIYS